MANKYIVIQGVDAKIHVFRKTLLGRRKVRNHKGDTVGPFNTVKEARDALEGVEQKRREDLRAKREAITESGVKYVFDPRTDEDLTITNQFRVIRSAKVEGAPFFLQELGLRGWQYVLETYERGSGSDKKTKIRKKSFATLAAAKTELIAIVQKLQEEADRKKKARVLEIIDSKVFELSEEKQFEVTA